MNPNNMNVAKAMVAQHELLDEARRSRQGTRAHRRQAKATPSRATRKSHGILGLLGLG
jgi:hypothetical protein